eukprot:750463-Hanusia_phi.AAC.5
MVRNQKLLSQSQCEQKNQNEMLRCVEAPCRIRVSVKLCSTADDSETSRQSPDTLLTVCVAAILSEVRVMKREEQGTSQLIEDKIQRHSQTLHEMSTCYQYKKSIEIITSRIESMDARVREESENLRKLDLKISQFGETGSPVVAGSLDCCWPQFVRLRKTWRLKV